MVLSELNNIASKVNPEFMDLCEVVVVNVGDRYWIPQNNIWININRDLVLRDMDTYRRRMVLVNHRGEIVDTNMELCKECGVPILTGTYCKECSADLDEL